MQVVTVVIAAVVGKDLKRTVVGLQHIRGRAEEAIKNKAKEKKLSYHHILYFFTGMRIHLLLLGIPFAFYVNHGLYEAVFIIVLGLLLGSLTTPNPAEKRGEDEFLYLYLTAILFITAKPCSFSCWVCLAAVFTEPSLTKPSEEGERNPC